MTQKILKLKKYEKEVVWSTYFQEDKSVNYTKKHTSQ